MNTRGKRCRAASLEEDKNANFLLHHHPRDYILKQYLQPGTGSAGQSLLLRPVEIMALLLGRREPMRSSVTSISPAGHQ